MNTIKNVLLFGYGKMGSSIARGWILKELDFNFFIIEKEASLRKIAIKDGFKTYENIEHINETKNSEIFNIIFLAVKPQQMEETVRRFYKFNLHKSVFVSIAAGLSFSWFRKKINKEIKIIRAMPNLPASIGFDVTGIDFVKSNIDIAKNHALKSELEIKYIYKNINSLNLDKKYDVILLLEVLEHLED